jgi:hypothetical protein
MPHLAKQRGALLSRSRERTTVADQQLSRSFEKIRSDRVGNATNRLRSSVGEPAGTPIQRPAQILANA